MNTLLIQNSHSWFQTDDEDIRKDLWRKLRWRERGCFHTRLYQQKIWDGYKDFFDKNTGKFLTGIIPEVRAYLDFHKIPYVVDDKRELVKWLYPELTDQFLNQWLETFNSRCPEEERLKSFTLRDYQPELANAVIKNYRGIVTAPTAAGKTAIMISIVRALPPTTPVLILAHRTSLTDSTYREMNWWGVPNLGRLYDKYAQPNLVTVANWQSVHKIAKVLPKFKVLIVDEIHEMMSKGPKKIYGKLTGCSVRVAVSATPFKFDGTDNVQKYSVKGFFGPILKVKSAGPTGILTTLECQNRGFLSASEATFFPISDPQLPYLPYQEAVTQGIAENWGFHGIVSRLAKSLTGRTLILVERLAHGDYLESLIPGALWVRGKDTLETRRFVIEQLKRSEENCVAIATQGIFNAGINVYVHNLINAAGGKADHTIIQRMGRGLRKAGDKAILNYYDFVFLINDYLKSHSEKRVKILKKQGHKVIVKDCIDF